MENPQANKNIGNMLIFSECSCLFLGMTISIWIYKIQLEYRQKVL